MRSPTYPANDCQFLVYSPQSSKFDFISSTTATRGLLSSLLVSEIIDPIESMIDDLLSCHTCLWSLPSPIPAESFRSSAAENALGKSSFADGA